ncbi:MAG TPA: aminomethyltransferase beta-barrel domain-containing protein, partial [Gammaproteobacteria bacterium]|nr:aminomethyltransferase beta-barrel domain-containing protein [Gammaproteobacteria bacterium]
DSTGICFIGERPFAEFLSRYLPRAPGPIVTLDGEVIGSHCGLAWYTLGQRHGLEIGGLQQFGPQPWYVAAKRHADNALVVVQGTDHPALHSLELVAEYPGWLSERAADAARTGELACMAKTRYRQPDQAAVVSQVAPERLSVRFATPQRAVTPGQYVVFYTEERCLGGARIAAVETLQPEVANRAYPSQVA